MSGEAERLLSPPQDAVCGVVKASPASSQAQAPAGKKKSKQTKQRRAKASRPCITPIARSATGRQQRGEKGKRGSYVRIQDTAAPVVAA